MALLAAALVLFGIGWPALNAGVMLPHAPAAPSFSPQRAATPSPDPPAHADGAVPAVLPAGKISISLNATPEHAAAPLSANFSANASATGASSFTLTWDFGDASTNQTFVLNASGGAASMRTNHSYPSPGNYTVNVTVTDNLADPHASGLLLVRVAPPFLVSLNLTPAHPVVGRPVVITPNANGGVSPYHVAWTGVPANCFAGSFNLTCIPAAPGNYSVRATVSDATVDRFSQDVFIVVTPRLFVTAAYQSAFTCVAASGVPVYNFTATTSGGDPPVNYTWTIGNGIGSAYGPAVTRTLPLNESFLVTLVAVDAIGEQATSSVSFSTSFPACGAVPSPNYAPPQALLVGGVVVGVVVIALLSAVLWKSERDRRRPPPPPLKQAVPVGARDQTAARTPPRSDAAPSPDGPPPTAE